MITLLKIRNFQSHHKSILKFHHGVNAIIGNTDSGKTAIFRAFNWLTGNSFTKVNFRSYWGGRTSVKIVTSENNTIVRSTGKKGNSYSINGTLLKAFGKTIPVEVTDILNIKDINYQSQHSPPFMLSNTAGEVARMLNKFANIDIVDSSQLNATRSVRYINDSITELKEQISIHKEKLLKFNFIPGLEKDVSILEDLDSKLQQLEKEKIYLSRLIQQRSKIDTKHLNFDIDKVEKQLKELVQEKENLDKKIETQNKLDKLINSIEIEMTSLKNSETIKKEIEDELKKIMPARCPLCNNEI